MGFWHTGYMEFHEYSGLGDYRYESSPPQYACAQCGQTYSTVDGLRKHRFESHPLHRPTLLLRGRELGSHPIRIASTLREEDVYAERCDRAVLNGAEISLSTLPAKLAQVSSDVCQLSLSSGEVTSEFTLDFRIATEDDLRGIEGEFQRTALGRRLDVLAIEAFIDATSRFESAIGYCDGICAYLYGVLAKEKAPDSSLPYEAYVGKYIKAAEELAAYDRPLARTIGSLIEFHFNHFSSAARLAGDARVGQAASRYQAWLDVRTTDERRSSASSTPSGELEEMVTDWETEQIARWAVRPLAELSPYSEDMETFLAREIAEYDRVKVQVLLAEIYASANDTTRVIQHAKALRNLSALERWAEGKIRTFSEEQDEYD